MANRIALHTDESYEDSDGFWVIAAEESVAGYTRINVWPSLAEAQDYVTKTNDDRGISSADGRTIIASSMGASST